MSDEETKDKEEVWALIDSDLDLDHPLLAGMEPKEAEQWRLETEKFVEDYKHILIKHHGTIGKTSLLRKWVEDLSAKDSKNIFVEGPSRELQTVLELKLQGFSNSEIARTMGLCDRRVEQLLETIPRSAFSEPPATSMWEEPSTSPACELVLELTIPEGVSDEEIVEAIQRLSLDANDLHRALGGNGLKIKELHIDAEVPAEVSIG